jgi:hypothetical protein
MDTPVGLSPWIGTAFIAAGVAVSLLSIRRHLRLVGDLNRGQFADRGPSRMAVILALPLALVEELVPMPLAGLIHQRLTATAAKGREESDWAGFAREVSESAGL